jgi:hypothetical protein
MTEKEKEDFRQKMIDKYDGEAHPFLLRCKAFK